jgi:virginiamycin B lyase
MKIAAALLLIVPALAPAQQIGIGMYSLPLVNNGTPGPYWIAPGPDGALWFTETWGNSIGRITTAGKATEYPLPTPGSFPECITAGPDGALWFTETAVKQIGRITTAGTITEYPAVALGITTGPDGALWFTGSTDNFIGRITTSGVITEYPLPAGNGYPVYITAGPDGALWFTEAGAGFGRITTAGVFTLYPVAPDMGQGAITTGPDGALWATGGAGTDMIARITTAGVATLYYTPTGQSWPLAITAGPDGALWFTEAPLFNEPPGQIGRITTAGVITEYPVPIPAPFYASVPSGIALGSDGELWFTEGTSGTQIGELVVPTANLSVNPPDGFYRSNLTFSGSGFAPNETVLIYYQGIGSNVLASATADASGSITVTAQAPQSPYGPRIFLGKGQNSGKVGAANFSMSPHLVLSPNSGPPGTTVTVEGFGFEFYSGVGVYWNNPRTLLGNAAADLYGAFSGSTALTITVPSDASPGVNEIFGWNGRGQPIGPGSFTVQ